MNEKHKIKFLNFQLKTLYITKIGSILNDQLIKQFFINIKFSSIRLASSSIV